MYRVMTPVKPSVVVLELGIVRNILVRARKEVSIVIICIQVTAEGLRSSDVNVKKCRHEA